MGSGDENGSGAKFKNLQVNRNSLKYKITSSYSLRAIMDSWHIEDVESVLSRREVRLCKVENCYWGFSVKLFNFHLMVDVQNCDQLSKYYYRRFFVCLFFSLFI